MLVFPNCKINLGLNITQKRQDGFHDIETVFYPINWCDALEVIDNIEGNDPFILCESGIKIGGKITDNLIFKAWQLLSEIKAIPSIKVHLHKNLPMGAGLGGGSSDAAFFINLINEKFNFNLNQSQKTTIASKLGSDCAFFINNKPVLAKGKGDQFSAIKVNLANYYILVVNPNINSNTADAYASITPKKPILNINHIIESTPINEWKTMLFNDFEESVFIKHPKIKTLKDSMYNLGAVYACMSGSGSSVFGIFETEPQLKFDPSYKYYLQTPALKTL